MSNDSKCQVVIALAALKRTDAKAYDDLLKKLNVERWSQISENDYGPVLMTCKAKTSGVALSDSEVVDELGGDPADDGPLREVYERAYGKAPPAKNLAESAEGAASVTDALNKMGKFDNHARRAAALKSE